MPKQSLKRLAFKRQYRARHKEQISAYFKIYHTKHRDELNAKKRAYRRAKRETFLCENAELIARKKLDAEIRRKELQKQSRKRNAQAIRGRIAVFRKKRRLADPGWRRAEKKRREADKIKAMPVWADRDRILEIYCQARASGLSVDHIVPLRSPIVCGLHVEHNLDLIPAYDNAVKRNCFWPDMP